MDQKIKNAEFEFLDAINAFTKEGCITPSQAVDLKSKVHTLTHKLLEIDKVYDSKKEKRLVEA